MNINRLTFVTFVTGLLFANSQGAVGIDFNVDSVRDALGVLVQTSGLGILVADTNGDGFGTISAGDISTGSLIGSDDYVLYRADFSNFSTAGVWAESISASLSDLWTTGNDIAFVWFPSLTNTSATVSLGTSYGLLSNPGIWTTPADGNDTGTSPYQIISTTPTYFSDDGQITTLNVSDEESEASFFVIPEPSTWSLTFAGLSCVGFMVRRKRRQPSV